MLLRSWEVQLLVQLLRDGENWWSRYCGMAAWLIRATDSPHAVSVELI